MDNFSKLFEAFREESTPEDILEMAIDLEIENFVKASGRDYWFDENIAYVGSEVVGWLKEKRPDFYAKVLKDPDELDGADELIDALQALGYMKEWYEVPEEDIQTPEDLERWKGAMGAYDD
jgi:hypothetical protein